MKKVKVSNELSKMELAKIKAANIRKARAFLTYCPFASNIYLAMKTKLPLSFIQENEEEIFSL